MTPRSRFRPAHALAALALILLSGCAGTRVNDVIDTHAAAMPAPHSIAVLIDVALARPPRHESAEAQAQAAQRAARALAGALASSLRERHLEVVEAAARPDLLLHARIVDLRSGNRALRLLVGYGAGRAELQVATRLERPPVPSSANDTPLLSFDTSSTTGKLPGSLIGAAVRSLGSDDGLDAEVRDTVTRIDAELDRYFAARGWALSTDSRSAR